MHLPNIVVLLICLYHNIMVPWVQWIAQFPFQK